MPSYARQPGASCFSCHTQPSATDLKNSLLSNGKTDSKITASAPVTGKIKAGVSVHKAPAEIGLVAKNRSKTEPGVQTESESFNKIGDTRTPAQGLSGFVAGEKFSASLTLLNNSVSGAAPVDTGASLWYRFAYAPKVDGLNLEMGVFGETPVNAGYALGAADLYGKTGSASSYGTYAQMQGNLFGDVTLNLKAMYINSSANSSQFKDEARALKDITDGYAAAARIGNKDYGLSAAYRAYRGKLEGVSAVENAATLGADLAIADNLTVKSQITAYGINRNTIVEDGAFTLWLISSF
ncbi:MAG: hypothetical protein HY751_07800 [Nitrospinae bacterium]|nr:hypothetical protein [Nitrospinota bacterium]